MMQKYCGYDTRNVMSSSYNEYGVVMTQVIMQGLNCPTDIVSSLLSEVFLAQLKLNHKQLHVHNNP